MKKPTLNESDLNYIKNRYEKRIEEHGVTFDSLKSGSTEKQQIRHQIHTSSFRTSSPSVLDIGCGLGDFYRYLVDNKISCHYTGFDIMKQYVEFCKENYPNCDFQERNVLENGIDKSYDNIVLSQVLNNRYQKSDNMEVMKQMLTECFEHANVAVSIDMMSEYVDFKSEELYYYSPEKIFSFAKTLTKRVAIRHDYRPYEFCIQLYKMESPGFVK
jgi:2-polyprenyl-3-methyl-5-hydroxy-6-metoxy-1,4-benzoquinol methylase